MGQERKLRGWPVKEGAEGDSCLPKEFRRAVLSAEGRDCPCVRGAKEHPADPRSLLAAALHPHHKHLEPVSFTCETG